MLTSWEILPTPFSEFEMIPIWEMIPNWETITNWETLMLSEHTLTGQE